MKATGIEGRRVDMVFTATACYLFQSTWSADLELKRRLTFTTWLFLT